MKMSALENSHAKRPALVLGGGPSLPSDYERVMQILSGATEGSTVEVIHIAINYHADMIGLPYDYIVYNDSPEHDPWMVDCLHKTKAIKVSPEPSSDILFDVPVWTGFYSSNTAAWFALWLGCDPVILLGMDCYQGEQKHCHADERAPELWHYALDYHLRPWYEEGVHKLNPKERIYVASGPLQKIFNKFP